MQQQQQRLTLILVASSLALVLGATVTAPTSSTPSKLSNDIAPNNGGGPLRQSPPAHVQEAYEDAAAYGDYLIEYLWAVRYQQLRKQLEEERRRRQQAEQQLLILAGGAGQLADRFGGGAADGAQSTQAPDIAATQRPTAQQRPPFAAQQPAFPQRPGLMPAPGCKQVGERCTYHSECCSNACLFYLGKCVSG